MTLLLHFETTTFAKSNFKRLTRSKFPKFSSPVDLEGVGRVSREGDMARLICEPRGLFMVVWKGYLCRPVRAPGYRRLASRRCIQSFLRNYVMAGSRSVKLWSSAQSFRPFLYSLRWGHKMAGKQFQLTSEELALSQLSQKQQQHRSTSTIPAQDRGHILARQWIQLEPIQHTDNVQRVKLFTWNVCPFHFVLPWRNSEIGDY